MSTLTNKVGLRPKKRRRKPRYNQREKESVNQEKQDENKVLQVKLQHAIKVQNVAALSTFSETTWRKQILFGVERFIRNMAHPHKHTYTHTHIPTHTHTYIHPSTD